MVPKPEETALAPPQEFPVAPPVAAPLSTDEKTEETKPAEPAPAVGENPAQ
jgi:predicted small lipoprotein YifL